MQMTSSHMGERAAIADIKKNGIDKVLFSYKYRVARRIRHLLYFEVYTDTVITYYLETNRINRGIDTVHIDPVR